MFDQTPAMVSQMSTILVRAMPFGILPHFHPQNEAENVMHEMGEDRGESRSRRKSLTQLPGRNGLNLQGKTDQVIDLFKKTISKGDQEEEKTPNNKETKEHDIDLSKNPCPENLEAVESKFIELDRNIREPCKIQENPGSLNTKGCHQQKAQDTGLIRAPRVLFVLAILAAQPFMGATATRNSTSQDLPEKCLEWMASEFNLCPRKDKLQDDFDRDWADLNNICCGHLQGTQLHCQTEELHSILACLPDWVVPPGIIGKLVTNATGYPVLDLKSECPRGSYRSAAVNSSFIPNQHCPKKKMPPDPEEEKVYDGGPSRDDLWVCKAGYKSDCPQGHNSRDPHCHCEPLQCADGQQPFRNITGHANDSTFGVEYGCAPASSVEVSTPSSQASVTTTEDTGSTTSSQTPPSAGPDPDAASCSKILIIVGSAVCVIIFILLIGLVVFCRCRWRQKFVIKDSVGKASVEPFLRSLQTSNSANGYTYTEPE